MQSTHRVLIGVCTYDEASNIEAMVGGLLQSVPDACVLVVDDNSPDGTSEIVQRMADRDDRIQLITRVDERGLGGAILRAAKESVQQGYQFFVNLDADLSHDPAQVPQLIAKAESDPELDVVVGSRYTHGGKIVGWPLRRRIMSGMVNRFARLCLRLPVSDCSGSMRCYRVSALEKLDLDAMKCRGYALLEELLVELKRKGCRMDEVPITFTERQHGESKLTLGEAVRSMSFMIKLALKPHRASQVDR